jgi:hypothetical protein
VVSCPANVTTTVSADALHGQRDGCGWTEPFACSFLLNNVNAGTATASYTYAGDANHTAPAIRRTSRSTWLVDHDRQLPGERDYDGQRRCLAPSA